MAPTSHIVAFLLIVATLTLYLFAAYSGRKRRITHPDDFFLAKNFAAPDDLGDAQIAYALQMATVYPFFVFAATGNSFVWFVNTFCWGLGIFLFYRWIPKFRGLLGRSSTVHAFVGRINGAARLRVIASILSIIGFTGLLLFEVVYGSTVLRALLGGDKVIHYVVVAVFYGYLAAYIWNGGQMSVLRSEQWQLVIAYAGLHSSVAYLFFQPLRLVPELLVGQMIAALVLLLSCVMLVQRIRSLIGALRKGRWGTAILYGIIVSSLGLMMYSIQANPSFLQVDLSHISAVMPHVGGLFWPMIATAVFFPLLWQFVDLTNWQRISSLAASSTVEYEKAARRGILDYLFESPLSWLLPLLLGVVATLVYQGFPSQAKDPFEDFVLRLFEGGFLGQTAGALLSVGIVGVFMSTASAALTAIGYAFAYDVWSPTRAIVDKTSLTAEEVTHVTKTGKVFMVFWTALVVALFILIDALFDQGPTFLGLLFAFFTPIVAFTPSALIPVLFRVHPHWSVAAISMSSGAAIGVVVGVYSAVGNPDLQWYAVPACFVTSWVVYLAGLALHRTGIHE